MKDLSIISLFQGVVNDRFLPVGYTLILNDQIKVASLMNSEQIVAQIQLSSSEMYFFCLLYNAFPEYVHDCHIPLSLKFVRKRVVPGLRRKMLSFAPHLNLLRLKEIGYMLVPIHA